MFLINLPIPIVVQSSKPPRDRLVRICFRSPTKVENEVNDTSTLASNMHPIIIDSSPHRRPGYYNSSQHSHRSPCNPYVEHDGYPNVLPVASPTFASFAKRVINTKALILSKPYLNVTLPIFSYFLK